MLNRTSIVPPGAARVAVLVCIPLNCSGTSTPARQKIYGTCKVPLIDCRVIIPSCGPSLTVAGFTVVVTATCAVPPGAITTDDGATITSTPARVSIVQSNEGEKVRL